MFGNCFSTTFFDLLITFSSRQPLLRMVLRSFSRRSTLTDLVSSVEVFLSSSLAPDFKCSWLGVTVQDDGRSSVLGC